MAVVVTSAFVSDETSNTMSFVIGERDGSEAAVPERFVEEDLVAAADQQDGAGNAPAAIPCSIAATARLGSTVSVLHDRRLERDEATRIDVELHVDAEGQRQVLHVGLFGRDVPAGSP